MLPIKLLRVNPVSVRLVCFLHVQSIVYFCHSSAITSRQACVIRLSLNQADQILCKNSKFQGIFCFSPDTQFSSRHPKQTYQRFQRGWDCLSFVGVVSSGNLLCNREPIWKEFSQKLIIISMLDMVGRESIKNFRNPSQWSEGTNREGGSLQAKSIEAVFRPKLHVKRKTTTNLIEVILWR